MLADDFHTFRYDQAWGQNHTPERIITQLLHTAGNAGHAASLHQFVRSRLNDGVAVVARVVHGILGMNCDGVAEPATGESHFSNLLHALGDVYATDIGIGKRLCAYALDALQNDRSHRSHVLRHPQIPYIFNRAHPKECTLLFVKQQQITDNKPNH